MRLTKTDIDNYVKLIVENKITLSILIEQLRYRGFSDEDLKTDLQNINNGLKIHLTKVKIRTENKDEHMLAWVAFSFLISSIGININAYSLLGHTVIILFLSVSAYILKSNNIMISIVSSVLFYFVLLFVDYIYFKDKSSYFLIEKFIVSFLSALPVFFIYNYYNKSSNKITK